MGNKISLNILIFSIFAIYFSSCNNTHKASREITDYKEYVLTLASKKVPGVLSNESNCVLEVYSVKKEQSNEWIPFGYIGGFEFEKGYEYKIKISETSYLDYEMGQPAWNEYELIEIISKDKKDSENIPLHFIPKSYYENVPLLRYKHFIDADNIEEIENDLKNSSILPTDYHYMLYRDKDGLLMIIGIQNDNNIFGPFTIKFKNKKPEEIMPESYKFLPPEGRIVGWGEWTFLNGKENETNNISFDVAIGYTSKTKSILLSPNTFNLYKDLTQDYQIQYPKAGIKTVVISYTLQYAL